MVQEPRSVEEAVGSLEELAEQQGRVSVGDMLDHFGHRSFGPVLMIFALLEISPVGGIPGLPSVLAFMCALLAAQMLFGHEHVWLPRFLEKRSLRSGRLLKALCRIEGLAHSLDKRFRNRLEQFTTTVWRKLAGMAIIALCLTVPPLELIPFASTAPMAAIAMFGLALTVRDGLLMLVATAASFLALTASILFVAPQVLGSG